MTLADLPFQIRLNFRVAHNPDTIALEICRSGRPEFFPGTSLGPDNGPKVGALARFRVV